MMPEESSDIAHVTCHRCRAGRLRLAQLRRGHSERTNSHWIRVSGHDVDRDGLSGATTDGRWNDHDYWTGIDDDLHDVDDEHDHEYDDEHHDKRSTGVAAR